MRIRVTADVVQKGDIEHRLHEIKAAFIGPKTVKVGLPSGKVQPSIIAYGFYNHFGTKGSGKGFVKTGKGGKKVGGFGGPIHSRPFIAAAMFEGQNEVKASLVAVGRGIVNGTGNLPSGLHRLGILGQNLIQDKITSGMAPANSPLTIEIKGSSTPLIDGGTMRAAVTWKIADE